MMTAKSDSVNLVIFNKETGSELVVEKIKCAMKYILTFSNHKT